MDTKRLQEISLFNAKIISMKNLTIRFQSKDYKSMQSKVLILKEKIKVILKEKEDLVNEIVQGKH